MKKAAATALILAIIGLLMNFFIKALIKFSCFIMGFALGAIMLFMIFMIIN
jgi:hypothetical protein